jgi:hypothetical protein
MAVPALRVLEDRDSADGKKIKRAVKGGIMVKGLPGATGIVTPGEDGTVIDVIDERGYVDGVKVARKCSKANVLGKAVEYIKVLKRREHRLRRNMLASRHLSPGWLEDLPFCVNGRKNGGTSSVVRKETSWTLMNLPTTKQKMKIAMTRMMTRMAIRGESVNEER